MNISFQLANGMSLQLECIGEMRWPMAGVRDCYVVETTDGWYTVPAVGVVVVKTSSPPVA